MKHNKIQLIFCYILTIVFIVACVIGGTIAGNKLSDLKDVNKINNKTSNEVDDDFVESEYLVLSDSFNDELECDDKECHGSFDYANYLETDRSPRYLNISMPLVDGYIECMGCQQYTLKINDYSTEVSGFSDVESYITDDEDYYLFVYRISYDYSMNKIVYIVNMYDEQLNLIKEDMKNFELINVKKDDKTSTYIMYQSSDENKIEFHRYTLSDNNDYVYYSINNVE